MIWIIMIMITPVVMRIIIVIMNAVAIRRMTITMYPCSTKTRAEGIDFPIPPESWWSMDILSSSNFLQGVDQHILPCGQGRIDSVKSILPC